jgi:regulator of replication initiation timing
MAENHALKNQIKNLVKENSELRAELKPKEKRLIVLGH